MKKASRLRDGYAAFACMLLMVLCPLFLPISSFYYHVIGGHAFLNHDLRKELHIDSRLFSTSTAVTLSAKRGGGGGGGGEDIAAALPTTRRIHAASPQGSRYGRRNLTQAEMAYLQQGCSRRKALVKVFMYDLPSELHFGMIEPTGVEEGQTWPTDFAHVLNYPGGLTLQHSPEYWLTLDLLSSLGVGDANKHADMMDAAGEPAKMDENQKSSLHGESEIGGSRPCAAVRVWNVEDADVFFVPFFSSLSYNRYNNRMRAPQRDEALQRRLVSYLMGQDAWNRSRGRDHVIVMHHPNSLHTVKAILGRATFIVADFARVSSRVSHLGKDIVAPYMHVLPTFYEDHTSFQTRPTLLFFQGAIQRKEGGIIRQRLYNVLKGEKDVIFKDGRFCNGQKTAIRGMRSSKFCLHMAGDTPSSNRLFDAIVSHCIPVIISKHIELPFEDILDYSKFCLFVSEEDALKSGFLLTFLRSMGSEEWTRMWNRLKEVQHHFEYQFPSQENDASQMVWKSLAHKLPFIRQGVHKLQRYSRSQYVRT